MLLCLLRRLGGREGQLADEAEQPHAMAHRQHPDLAQRVVAEIKEDIAGNVVV